MPTLFAITVFGTPVPYFGYLLLVSYNNKCQIILISLTKTLTSSETEETGSETERRVEKLEYL